MAPIFVGSNDDNSRVRSDRVGFAISTSNPGSASEGDAYYNSSDSQLNIYDGSDWASAGAGGNSVELVASGTLSDGQTVVVTSDGKVAGVTTVGVALTSSSATDINSTETAWISAAYDENTERVLVVYQDTGNSDYGTAVVGTVNSDNTITFGTPTVFQSNQIIRTSAIYHPGIQKVVFSYGYSSGMYLRTAIIDASNNTVTFGSAVSASITSMTGGDTQILIYVASITDAGAITFPSSEVRLSASGNNPYAEATSAAYAGSGKTVVAWVDQSDSYNTYYSTITVSGTTITATAQATGPLWTQWPTMVYHAEQQKLVLSGGGGSTGRIAYKTGTISGTTVTWGNTIFAGPYRTGGETAYLFSRYDSLEKKIVYTYRQNSPSRWEAAEATLVGVSSVVLDNTIIVGGFPNSSYAYQDYSSSLKGNVFVVGAGTSGRATIVETSRVGTNMTANNFLGFSDAAYSDGQTAKIQIAGSVDDAQSGLTTAKKHYVQNDGSLSTTAGDPSVEAGVGISTTQIIVLG